MFSLFPSLPHFFVLFAQSISMTLVLFFLCNFTFHIFSEIHLYSRILSSVKIIMGNRDVIPQNHLESERAEEYRD